MNKKDFELKPVYLDYSDILKTLKSLDLSLSDDNWCDITKALASIKPVDIKKTKEYKRLKTRIKNLKYKLFLTEATLQYYINKEVIVIPESEVENE